MKVLILGHKGQLGKSLLIKIPKQIKLYTDKIFNKTIIHNSNFLKLYKEINPNVIVNCIAYTKVDKAEENSRENNECYEVNSNFLKTISEIITDKTLFVHLSTDYVFDGNRTEPYNVDDAVNPINQYGKSKQMGELYIQNKFKNYIIIRTSSLFSLYGSNFVKTIFNLFSYKKSIKVVNDQYFFPTPAEDLAKIIWEICLSYNTNITYKNIFHFVGSGDYLNWYEFACLIKNKASANTVILPECTANLNFLAKRPLYSVLSDTLIREKFNFHSVDWREYLSTVISEIKN